MVGVVVSGFPSSASSSCCCCCCCCCGCGGGGCGGGSFLVGFGRIFMMPKAEDIPNPGIHCVSFMHLLVCFLNLYLNTSFFGQPKFFLSCLLQQRKGLQESICKGSEKWKISASTRLVSLMEERQFSHTCHGLTNPVKVDFFQILSPIDNGDMLLAYMKHAHQYLGKISSVSNPIENPFKGCDITGCVIS